MAPLSDEQTYTFAASPTEWREWARELADAAERLWRDSSDLRALSSRSISGMPDRRGLSRPVIFLAALSIENLLKGLRIMEDPQLVANGRLHGSLIEHRLDVLLKGLQSTTPTSLERELCAVLSRAIPYWGRYPVPLTAKNIERESTLSEDLFDLYRRLFRKLDAELYRQLQNGWDGPHGMRLDSTYDSELEKRK